jgi:hypothetical protein
MAFNAYVDSVALDTATGDQTVSPGSLTFTPTGAVFSGNKLTADGGLADANWFLGVAASAADERYMAFESEDASAAADVGAVALANGCMSGLLDNNSVDFVGDFTSFNASPAGISFNLSNAPASASILNYLLLGGDVTGIQTFVLNLGTGTGNVSVSSLSGTPSCVIFFAAAAVSSGDTFAAATSNGTNMVGWMCADGTQGVCGSRHTDGAAAGDTARWQRTDRCIDFRSVSADLANGAFVSMDANGFTVSVNTPTDSIRVYGFAVYGGVWTAGAFNSSTGTGSTGVTTTGVAPKLVMLQTFGNAADTATQVHGRRGFGMTDGTRRWAVAYDDLDGSDPTVTDSYLDRTRALVSITAGTPTLNDAYDVTLDAEGFTYDHEVASGTAIQVIYLVGGDEPVSEADADSDGAATVTGVGAAVAASVTDSDGLGTATGTGAALATSVASSAGIATATGEGEDAAAGGNIVEADASSSGSATATSVGAAVFAGVSAAAGLAVAASVAAALFLGAASSVGVGAGSGQSAAFVVADGSSVGLATVSGSGAALGAGTASATGTAAATGSAAALGAGVGNAAGVATVTGQGANGAESGGDGSATGSATASGTGAALAAASGASAGVATVTANTAVVVAADATAAGTATAQAVSGADHGGVGSSQGSAICQADSEDAGVPPDFGRIFSMAQRQLDFAVTARQLDFIIPEA